MSKLYNIIDRQLGDYYDENITFEETWEHGLRFAGQASVDDEFGEQVIEHYTNSDTYEQVWHLLNLFGYELEEA